MAINPDHFSRIPSEILSERIFPYLQPQEIAHLRAVSKATAQKELLSFILQQIFKAEQRKACRKVELSVLQRCWQRLPDPYLPDNSWQPWRRLGEMTSNYDTIRNAYYQCSESIIVLNEVLKGLKMQYYRATATLD